MRKIGEQYPDHKQVRLKIGDGGVFAQPSVVTTVLGSCVSVTFFCRAKRIGAIFHAILPIMPDKEKNQLIRNHYKYVDASIHHILHSFYGRGIRQNQIEAKLFGGSQAFVNGLIRTGPNNIMTAYEVLSTHNMKIVASDVGGEKGRNLVFISNTGEVFIKNHKHNFISSASGNTKADHTCCSLQGGKLMRKEFSKRNSTGLSI